MAFLLLGLALAALKLAEIGPVAAWSWWVVLSPFGLTVAWWSYADRTGLTQRRAIDKMEKRKAERRQRAIEALGQHRPRDGRANRGAAVAAAARPNAPPAAPRSPASPRASRFNAPTATPGRKEPEL